MSDPHVRGRAGGAGTGGRELPCPFSLNVEPVARFLNFELADDPVYEGLELQFLDDDVHGTGMLAFLQRRADRRVDYHFDPGLRLDRASYTLGAGVGEWQETSFDAARLEIAEDGVVAEARFEDAAGRPVEIRIDDRDGRRRRRAELLAPVSAGIDHPRALLLVLLHGFDLVRDTGSPPVIRIGGRPVATGRLPGARLHHRHLIKYAAPLSVVELNRSHDGPLPAGPHAGGEVERAGGGIAALAARHGAHHARLALTPALPELASLTPGTGREGRWSIAVDGARLTGGPWTARRHGDVVELGLEVSDRWKPGPLPPLMRFVTTVVPTFRRWPTSYRWTARITLGPEPTMASRWERVGDERGTAYRRATGS